MNLYITVESILIGASRMSVLKLEHLCCCSQIVFLEGTIYFLMKEFPWLLLE